VSFICVRTLAFICVVHVCQNIGIHMCRSCVSEYWHSYVSFMCVRILSFICVVHVCHMSIGIHMNRMYSHSYVSHVFAFICVACIGIHMCRSRVSDILAFICVIHMCHMYSHSYVSHEYSHSYVSHHSTCARRTASQTNAAAQIWIVKWLRGMSHIRLTLCVMSHRTTSSTNASVRDDGRDSAQQYVVGRVKMEGGGGRESRARYRRGSEVYVWESGTLRCSVLQCVAVCFSVLQCVVEEVRSMSESLVRCVAVCCSVLQYVAVCCWGSGVYVQESGTDTMLYIYVYIRWINLYKSIYRHRR